MKAYCVLALAVLAGCGGASEEPAAAPPPPPPAWHTHSDAARGYEVRLPASWHRATERISRLTEPRELLTVATMPVAWHETDCEAFAGAAGYAMGRDDVAVTVWERGRDEGAAWNDFPHRPRHFGPVRRAAPAGPGCGEPEGTIVHWRNFGEGDRHLHTLVRTGPDAPPAAVEQAWRILDGLRLDPGYAPSWRASG